MKETHSYPIHTISDEDFVTYKGDWRFFLWNAVGLLFFAFCGWVLPKAILMASVPVLFALSVLCWSAAAACVTILLLWLALKVVNIVTLRRIRRQRHIQKD